MPILPTPQTINAFLHFGWLPRTDVTPPIPADWLPAKPTTNTMSMSVGADLLRTAVATHLGNRNDIVIPLSGGLDSRTMLAIALEQGRSVTTATLGVPGTYDYDIGAYVAKKLSLPHHTFNVNKLLSHVSTTDVVTTIAKTGDWGNSIETYANLNIAEVFTDRPIVSGFLGDFIGGMYTGYRQLDWVEAKSQFSRDGCVSRKIRLTNPDFSLVDYLPASPTLSRHSTLTPYEELVLTTRHTCSLRPTLYTHDFGYITPFRNRDWVEYMFGTPTKERVGPKLYRHILATTWPDLFSLPTKTYLGFPLIHTHWQYRLKAHLSRVRAKAHREFPVIAQHVFGIDPMHNYTDWHNQFMYNKNFRQLARENLTDLAARNCVPWVPVQKLVSHYLEQSNRIDYSTGIALLVLLNLEINLKTSDI